MAYEQHETRRRGIGTWSRTRWLVLAGAVIAVAVVLLIVFVGGSSGGGGAGGGGGWG